MQHLQKTEKSNSIHYDQIRLVIKVWDVIVRITTVTLGSIISNPQMIESRKKDQYADDENWNRAIWVLQQNHTLLSNILTDIYNPEVLFTHRNINVSCQKKGSNNNQYRANQK